MPYKNKKDKQKHSEEYYLKYRDSIMKRVMTYQRNKPEVHYKASMKWSRNNKKQKAEYLKHNRKRWDGWIVTNCLVCGRFIPKYARKYCSFEHKELGRKLNVK